VEQEDQQRGRTARNVQQQVHRKAFHAHPVGAALAEIVARACRRTGCRRRLKSPECGIAHAGPSSFPMTWGFRRRAALMAVLISTYSLTARPRG
jgi:hypothetical protein